MKLLVPFLLLSLVEAKPNLANAKDHPYADTSGGREGYTLADETVNEARLYEFYQRQADYYLAHPDKLPDVLPSYPGLDGGKHGHWGKHNQNNHSDSRWNDAEMGEVITQVFRGKDLVVLKGIAVRLGENRELSVCFDPMSLRYRAIWEGGFVKFQGFRWGTSRNAHLDGSPWMTLKKATMPEGGKYLGYYRYGKRTVFRYQIGSTRILDEPYALHGTFFRRIDVSPTGHLDLPLEKGLLPDIVSAINVEAAITNNILSLKNARKGASVIIRQFHQAPKSGTAVTIPYLNTERKATRRWTEKITMPGTLGDDSKPYAVDTLTVPYDNPYRVVMQLSGLAFLPNGDALACTLQGDVWRISNINGDLKNVTWQRYATGFNQPIGIHVDQFGVFILDRGQIYRLHDLNKDGEIDYYENYANDFGGYDRSHTHTFGLHRTADGAFHFIQRESILRTGPDQKTSLQGSGVRNCMGIGGTKDYFWVAPQEGTWTPASAIIEVNKGEFYGLPNKAGKAGSTIAPPLCFIPRGVDNSTGGMVEITSDKWGPIKGAHLGLSYGSGLHYLILRDDSSSRPQGAVVPLEGEFISGSMRAAFHPTDGQLYLVGLDGWGDYSIRDGCFHRVRYTGKNVYKPNGFQVFENGIKIDFTDKLNAPEAKKFFAQQWNYEYAKRYGSPEFSKDKPDSLGHDHLKIRSVKLLDGGSSIFVELPDLEAVMQLHIRMHLTAANGHEFKTDLFPSPMFPGQFFEHEGLAPRQSGKLKSVALRITRPKAKKANTESGQAIEGEKPLTVDAIGGLQYQQKLLTAEPGQALALKFSNKDVMPHNLVIVKPGAKQKIGEAAFKMISDPKAGEKHYVPDFSEVLHFVPVINAEESHTLHFRAPNEPGDYPYICTYPGHWQAMQGILRVR